jgi:hypothetical protein
MALRLLPSLALLLLASAPFLMVSAADPDPLADFVVSGPGQSTSHLPKPILICEIGLYAAGNRS